MVDLDRFRAVATIPLPGRPRWAVYDPVTDRVFVNIREPAQILSIGADRLRIDRAIDVPAEGPHGLWIDGACGHPSVWGRGARAQTATAWCLRHTGPFIEGGQGTTAALAAGSLWINSAGPSNHTLLCVDPRTGRIRKRVDVPKQLDGNSLTSDVIRAGRFLYVGTDKGLVRFSPDVCRG